MDQDGTVVGGLVCCLLQIAVGSLEFNSKVAQGKWPAVMKSMAMHVMGGEGLS